MKEDFLRLRRKSILLKKLKVKLPFPRDPTAMRSPYGFRLRFTPLKMTARGEVNAQCTVHNAQCTMKELSKAKLP